MYKFFLVQNNVKFQQENNQINGRNDSTNNMNGNEHKRKNSLDLLKK